jgi:Fic family protein
VLVSQKDRFLRNKIFLTTTGSKPALETGGLHMQPYLPPMLPIENIDALRLLPYVSKASGAVGRYDSSLKSALEPNVILTPIRKQEAVLSSKIEGTRVTLDEVLEQEAGIPKDGDKSSDIKEILNYNAALNAAHEEISAGVPITLHLIRGLHKILLDSVRGANKSPGEFRREQNWIGTYGHGIEKATYVPPDPVELPMLLDNFTEYILSDDLDPFIQTGIMHAQFELIHPFKDGNGRMGRILIPLFLFQKGVIAQPVFYLSAYLESHRDEYYSRLKGISESGDWNGWLEFFLKATALQAEFNDRMLNDIAALNEKIKSQLTEIGNTKYDLQILDALFRKPIFSSTDFAESVSGVTRQTVNLILRSLDEADILDKTSEQRGRRPATYRFTELLDIVTRQFD